MTQDELLKLIDEAAADRRTTLDLSGQGLAELPPEIGRLTNLKTLVLGRWDRKKSEVRGNRLKTLPDEMGQLTGLRSLFLAYNQFEELPEVVGQLARLRSLYLSRNQLTTLPDVVAQLSSLTSLNLSFNQLTTLPDVVAQLSSLTSLNLSFNQLTTLPDVVAQLSSLTSLNLGGNQLTTLPDVVAQLSSLTSLNLGGNQLTALPDVVAQLSSLTSLNLSRNQLTALPDVVAQLSSLTSLYLSFNQLTTLPDVVAQLSSLTSLYLSFNQLTTLPDVVAQLSSLTSLNLGGNQLTTLPSWVKAFERLDHLDLRGNPLPIPPEILGPKEPWKNPSSALKTLGFYFALQQEAGSTALYEAKLILIGEGGAGKTSLAKKIENEQYKLQDDEESTEGIDVIRWDFPLPDGNTFRVNIWDFGGQEIYHATHQFFLTKRSLYFLVADTRQDNTDFYYWLKIVELLSDSSPVLVIKNEKQDRKCEIDEGLFKKQFNNLKDYLPTNLKDNRDLDKIKDAIRYHITQLPHVGNPLPKIWVRVRAALENYAQNCNTITIDKYFDICRQNGFTDKQQMLFLSSYLHDLGVCLHFQDDRFLKRTVVLKPDWATTAVYKVADSDTVRNHKGHFTEADTAKIWNDSQYSDLRDELLQLMMRFKLAYELPNQPGQYITPQLLPISQPDYPWDSADNLILRYTYDFMPKGILTSFIVETNQLIENQDHVWKNGVVLADNWARAQIIENYPKKEIEVKVSGSNKKPLLEKVRYELWKIHESYERLQYQELIPCNCSQCKGHKEPESYAHELLMHYVANREYEIKCHRSFKQVDVRRLISDITDKTDPYDMRIGDRTNELMDERFKQHPSQPPIVIHNNIQSDRTTNTISQQGKRDNIAGDSIGRDKIGTQANNSQVPQTTAPKSSGAQIFLSYAREDGNPAAERIRREMHSAGFSVWRDIENMQGGKEWKAQLRTALHQVEAIIVLLTPKSVESKYVEWELEMARMIDKPILPVLILDCDIPDELDRIHYRNLSIEQGYNQDLLLLIQDLNNLSR